jgi:uncharacterized protein
MKKIILISIFAVIFLLSGIFLLSELKKDISPSLSEETPRALLNSRTIRLEIADTRAKQAQGLSDRPQLKENEGMLFVFPEKQVRRFWMKNMHFPLDIIWLDDEKIVYISKNLAPEGESPQRTYSSVYPVNHVLEINAGLCDRYRLKAGDTIELHY